MPTEEELLALRVNWLALPMEQIIPQSIRQNRKVLQDYDTQVPQQRSQFSKKINLLQLLINVLYLKKDNEL